MSRLIVIALLFVAVVLFIGKMSLGREITISKEDNPSLWNRIIGQLPFARPIQNDPDYVMPAKENDRLDILVLGMRGTDEPENGGMLTDAIMLLSYNETTKRVAMVSIPRDLYVRFSSEHSDKINAAYEDLGLGGVKKLVSQITGVYVDYAVVFDFSSFKEIVDTLGGVDITLAKPFSEKSQWGYEFSLPAGQNHLDGETALYYVRSRYSTSDFDRAWRQQQVIMAIKQKALALNVLSEPGTALNLLNVVRKNIKTDYGLGNISSMMSLADQLTDSSMRRVVLTTENFLIEDHINGMYVLLPDGGSFAALKTYLKTVCDATPAPLPSRSASPMPSASK